MGNGMLVGFGAAASSGVSTSCASSPTDGVATTMAIAGGTGVLVGLNTVRTAVGVGDAGDGVGVFISGCSQPVTIAEATTKLIVKIKKAR